MSGANFDITYPYYDKQCDEEGECPIGMIMSLDCTAEEQGFKPFFQCDIPDSIDVADTEAELNESRLSGVWFPTPTCSKLIIC